MWKGIIVFLIALFALFVSPALARGGVEGLLAGLDIIKPLFIYSVIVLVVLVIGVNLLGAFSKGRGKEVLSLKELTDEVLNSR